MRRDHLAIALELPPGAVARRAVDFISRPIVNVVARHRDAARPTYGEDALPAALRAIVDDVPIEALRTHRHSIESAAEQSRHHRFDLLGSGLTKVAHGASCAGLEGVRYPPYPTVTVDKRGDWLADRINPSNVPVCRAIWPLVDVGYEPIDWQLDFKTGYRWSELTWSTDLVFGVDPYVDVKVPWELARLQHLVVLAFAFALSNEVRRGDQADVWWREFRNQVLDFIATNPPRYGANWRCTMDVAIRGANIALAYGMFAAAGATPDPEFVAVLATSIRDHAQHVVDHLERFPEGRGNHYLADIAGLAFLAATLSESKEADSWLAFAVRELVAETKHQFNNDGTNFEGSTSYHRLSGELVVFTTALAVGQSARIGRGSIAMGSEISGTRPHPPLGGPAAVDDGHFARIVAMAEFTAAILKDNGRIPQIGDNDNGRLFMPHPTAEVLDHRAFVAAAAALVDLQCRPAPDASVSVEN